jgi:predicted nucleic acid-binding protein
MLKYKINDLIIQDNIEVIICASEITLIDISTIRLAHKVRLQQQFSYWDSLIVASAIHSGCDTLYTEDLQHKQRIEQLTVINPFI